MNLLACLCFTALGCLCTVTGIMFTLKAIVSAVALVTDDENDKDLRV